MAAQKSNNVFSTQYPSGIVFVGSIIVGVAVGLLRKDVGAFTLLGIGVGFVLAGIVATSGRNKYLDR